jgi:glycosyltransferase involved in cell wall biosynthesis
VRVMQVITSGVAGGAQSHVLALCQALAGKAQLLAAVGSGHGSGGWLGGRLREVGVETHYLQHLRNSTNPLQLVHAVRELIALMHQQRPDLVHAHSSYAGAAARIAARWCGIPAIYTVHGFGFKPQARPIVRELAWLGESALAPLTRQMICVSRHESTLAARLPFQPNAVSVIPNGLPDVPWQGQPAAEPADLVMVARLAAPKRVDLLLQALSMLGASPAVRIIGDGPDRARLEAQARDLRLSKVQFTGTLDDVPQQLARHAVFVLLSDHEGLPISVIEAMRAELAIVASRLPGIEEMLTHEQSALLVDNEPVSIRDALARLIAEPGLRARLGQAARARYKQEFEAGQMADRVLALYQEAVQAGAQAPA